MARDFITFGRTQLYFVNDLYNIIAGIVEVLSPVYPAGESDPNDVFTLRYKTAPNTYTTVNVYRKDVRFDIEGAKSMLIEKLKAKYKSSQNFTFTVTDLPTFTTLEAFLYVNGKDIFSDDNVDYCSSNTSSVAFGNDMDEDDIFKIVLRLNDTIYNTNVTDATVYNNKLKTNISFNNCTAVTVPTDYNSYCVHITDIPETEYNKSAKVLIENANDEAETSSKTITTSEITTTRFFLSSYNTPTLSYYKPSGEYDLYLKIGDTVYLYNEKASDFDTEQTFSFLNFTEVTNG